MLVLGIWELKTRKFIFIFSDLYRWLRLTRFQLLHTANCCQTFEFESQDIAGCCKQTFHFQFNIKLKQSKTYFFSFLSALLNGWKNSNFFKIGRWGRWFHEVELWGPYFYKLVRQICYNWALFGEDRRKVWKS